jgi:Uma2 family endonuclease
VEIGAFGEDDPIELLEGWVVEKMPKNPPHDSTVDRCVLLLNRILPPGWYARGQNSLVTSDSVPEPDGAVVRGTTNDYDERHQTAADTALVIEVAESSLMIDRDKARLYARAGIDQYWIVNLIDRQMEVYSRAVPQEGAYAERKVLSSTDDGEFQLPTGEIIRLSVSQLLPKPVA